MTIYSVAALITVRTFSTILSAGLTVAQGLGVDTTTWRSGDPTRSTYNFLAESLSTSDGMVAEFIKAGFLSSASGDWLKLLAQDQYGVPFTEASFATSTVTIKNNGGGVYPVNAGGVTFKSTVSGKTYHNVSAAAPLTAGVQITLDVVADDSGSDSSAGVNEIDSLVTTMLGVDILSSTAAVGIDEQSEDSLKQQCLDSRGALSPNGPADAYAYVSRNPLLTGAQDITRASVEANSGTLAVTIYIAGPSGPVAGASVTAAQAAIEQWATPLCITPTVVNSAADVIPVTATITGVLPSDYLAKINTALGQLFAGLPIGIGTGYDIDPTAITSAMRVVVPQIGLITPYTPNTLTHVAAGHVPVLGSVTITAI